MTESHEPTVDELIDGAESGIDHARNILHRDIARIVQGGLLYEHPRLVEYIVSKLESGEGLVPEPREKKRPQSVANRDRSIALAYWRHRAHGHKSVWAEKLTRDELELSEFQPSDLAGIARRRKAETLGLLQTSCKIMKSEFFEGTVDENLCDWVQRELSGNK